MLEFSKTKTKKRRYYLTLRIYCVCDAAAAGISPYLARRAAVIDRIDRLEENHFRLNFIPTRLGVCKSEIRHSRPSCPPCCTCRTGSPRTRPGSCRRAGAGRHCTPRCLHTLQAACSAGFTAAVSPSRLQASSQRPAAVQNSAGLQSSCTRQSAQHTILRSVQCQV